MNIIRSENNDILGILAVFQQTEKEFKLYYGNEYD